MVPSPYFPTIPLFEGQKITEIPMLASQFHIVPNLIESGLVHPQTHRFYNCFPLKDANNIATANYQIVAYPTITP